MSRRWLPTKPRKSQSQTRAEQHGKIREGDRKQTAKLETANATNNTRRRAADRDRRDRRAAPQRRHRCCISSQRDVSKRCKRHRRRASSNIERRVNQTSRSSTGEGLCARATTLHVIAVSRRLLGVQCCCRGLLAKQQRGLLLVSLNAALKCNSNETRNRIETCEEVVVSSDSSSD